MFFLKKQYCVWWVKYDKTDAGWVQAPITMVDLKALKQ